MERPRNPFILSHRIFRPYFCDREEEQKRLTSAVINGRNMVLISPRRMGKTSLTHVAFNDSPEISEEYTVFFFDILQTNSLREFTFLLGKTIFDTLAKKGATRVRGFLAVLKSLKGSFGFDPTSGLPSFNIQLGDITAPEYTLEEIFRYLEQSDKPTIMVIDEFQQITKYPEKNVEAILRSHVQKLSHTSFVFAGSEQTLLQEMFVSSKRPFYNSSEIMHLAPIPEDVYVEFARKMFADYGKSIEAEAVRKISRLFDGNTFYMQRTLNGVFADATEDSICGHDAVAHSIKAMLASNEILYREILSSISASQKATLIAIAGSHVAANPLSAGFIKANALTSASSVQSSLLKLTKSGMISKTEKGYSLTDSLFRIFINQLYSTAEI